jgi:hypothetical protein
MKTIVASVLALGLMTSAALAEPVKLSETGMDQVRAGEGIALAITCTDGRCQTVESRGPVAAVACVNGRCQVLR